MGHRVGPGVRVTSLPSSCPGDGLRGRNPCQPPSSGQEAPLSLPRALLPSFPRSLMPARRAPKPPLPPPAPLLPEKPLSEMQLTLIDAQKALTRARHLLLSIGTTVGGLEGPDSTSPLTRAVVEAQAMEQRITRVLMNSLQSPPPEAAPRAGDEV